MNAIEHLIQDNTGLVYMQLHRFDLAYNEEAISYAMEALFKAAESFDKDAGVTFATYATSCIYNGIMRYYRYQNKKRVDTISIEEHTTPNGEILLPSFSNRSRSAEDELLSLSELELRGTIIKVLGTFKEGSRAYEAIKIWIDSDFTAKTVDIAPMIGSSQPSVSRAINAFRDRLKEELKDAKT